MSELTEEPLVLSGLTILDDGGTHRKRTLIPDGSYSLHGLERFLADHWVFYFECHKCGRWHHCKFGAKPHPANPNRSDDIQCGVVVEVLRNFLWVSWEKLLTYDAEECQHFLDGLFYYVRFISDAEISIGGYTDRDQLEWWGPEFARRIFAIIARLRVDLDQFAAEFATLEDFAAGSLWVLVEGESEKEFLKRLVELRFILHIGGVESYGGKGNAKLNKLYITSLGRRGYTVVLQGDRHGGKRDRLAPFVSARLVEPGMAFLFSTDFEGSFPPRVLWAGLLHAGYRVDARWLYGVMSRPQSTPIVGIIEDKLKQPIDKVKLARSLAEVISSWQADIYRHCLDNEIVQWVYTLRFGRPLAKGLEDQGLTER